LICSINNELQRAEQLLVLISLDSIANYASPSTPANAIRKSAVKPAQEQQIARNQKASDEVKTVNLDN
jgi:hypothetical protein